jgi:hypothetical protein
MEFQLCKCIWSIKYCILQKIYHNNKIIRHNFEQFVENQTRNSGFHQKMILLIQRWVNICIDLMHEMKERKTWIRELPSIEYLILIDFCIHFISQKQLKNWTREFPSIETKISSESAFCWYYNLNIETSVIIISGQFFSYSCSTYLFENKFQNILSLSIIIWMNKFESLSEIIN